jgi:hypothetical protein
VSATLASDQAQSTSVTQQVPAVAESVSGSSGTESASGTTARPASMSPPARPNSSRSFELCEELHDGSVCSLGYDTGQSAGALSDSI